MRLKDMLGRGVGRLGECTFLARHVGAACEEPHRAEPPVLGLCDAGLRGQADARLRRRLAAHGRHGALLSLPPLGVDATRPQWIATPGRGPTLTQTAPHNADRPAVPSVAAPGRPHRMGAWSLAPATQPPPEATASSRAPRLTASALTLGSRRQTLCAQPHDRGPRGRLLAQAHQGLHRLPPHGRPPRAVGGRLRQGGGRPSHLPLRGRLRPRRPHHPDQGIRHARRCRSQGPRALG